MVVDGSARHIPIDPGKGPTLAVAARPAPHALRATNRMMIARPRCRWALKSNTKSENWDEPDSQSRPDLPEGPFKLPAAVARSFVKDMRDFFAEPNPIKQDEIAARQLHALKPHYADKLRLHDVKQMFWSCPGITPGAHLPAFGGFSKIHTDKVGGLGLFDRARL
jgi:hypothetical protein